MKRSHLILPLLCVAGAALAAAPWQAEQQLKDNALKKLAKPLGEMLQATVEGKDGTKAQAAFRKEVEKVDKKLKDTELLALPADLARMIWLSNNYEKNKIAKKATGKIETRTEDFNGMPVEYAIWTPSKYKPKTQAYPLIITIPAEGENPERHISERWTHGDLLDEAIIACPKMPGDSKTWEDSPGVAATLLTLRYVTENWGVDPNRVFLGGRERGGEAAIAITEMFPKLFAGAFAWAADAGEGIRPENLMHVPVFISGGGNASSGLEERNKAVEGAAPVTLDPDGGAPEIHAWMKDLTRANYPDKVTIIQGEKLPTGAYWLSFDRVPPGSEARLDGVLDRETNTITLTGKGILSATVWFSDGMLDLDKPVKVIANGVEHVDQFQRNMNKFVASIESADSDGGRVFVASKIYNFPPAASSDDKGGE